MPAVVKLVPKKLLEGSGAQWQLASYSSERIAQGPSKLQVLFPATEPFARGIGVRRQILTVSGQPG
jgi:hypothetical protein